MINLMWQLTPGGLIAEGENTYYILSTKTGTYLQVKNNGDYQKLMTFTCNDPVSMAKREAQKIEDKALETR